MRAKGLTRTLLAAATAIGLMSPTQAAELGAVDEPITLSLFEWTGQHVTSQIYGHILREMGYEVEHTTAGYLSSGQAVADGGITVAVEMWGNNLGDFYPGLISEGKIEDLGDVGISAREGWLYPAHVKEVCPGLPAWDAFKSCAQAFAMAETYPKGRLLAYPADWGTRSADLIAGEGLDFVAVPAGSEGALVAEMTSAIEAKTPLVQMFWSPHWSLATIDAEWVDIPDEVMEKYSMVPPRTFNAAWPGMKDKWPAAYEFLKEFRISNDIQEPIMGAVDNDGADIVALTKQWVDENEALWKPVADKAAM
ncbi:MAG: ABC transporter substrate-binding protein [Pseudomonadota bacterium]